MKQPVKKLGGFLFILIGVTVLLGLIGIHLGSIVGLAIGSWLLYWGYSRSQEKERWTLSSIVLVAVGALIIFGGLGGVASLLFGILLVYAGYKLIKPESSQLIDDESEHGSMTTYDVLDDEIEKLLGNK